MGKPTEPQFDVPQLRRAADAVQHFFDMSPEMVKTRTAVADLMRGAADEIVDLTKTVQAQRDDNARLKQQLNDMSAANAEKSDEIERLRSELARTDGALKSAWRIIEIDKRNQRIVKPLDARSPGTRQHDL